MRLSALVLDGIQVRAAVPGRQDDQLYLYAPSARQYRLGSYSSLWFCLPRSSCCERVILPYGIQVVTSFRGSLVGMIYSKTVDLSITAIDESAAVTLMSTDTETICLAFMQVHEIWAVPIETGLAFWLLQRQIGSAFLAVAMVAIVGVISTIWLSRFMGTAQKRWIRST